MRYTDQSCKNHESVHETQFLEKCFERLVGVDTEIAHLAMFAVYEIETSFSKLNRYAVGRILRIIPCIKAQVAIYIGADTIIAIDFMMIPHGAHGTR